MSNGQRERAAAIIAGAQEYAAQTYGIRWETLMRTRTTPVVYMRAVAIALLRKEGLSLKEIGGLLGLHHTTILHALQMLPAYKTDNQWRGVMEGVRSHIRLEEIQTQSNEIMINATILGTIGRDAEPRLINDKQYSSFSVAVDGRKGEDTTWLKVLAYAGKGAGYYRKGAKIVATGRLTFGVYNGKPDVTLWADNIEIAKFAEDGKPQQQAAPAPRQEEVTDFDLPF